MENWHNRLVEIREKHLLKQKDIADAIGKDITRVSRYERGRGAKYMPAFMKRGLRTLFTDEEIHYIETGEFPSSVTGNVQHGSWHVMVHGNRNRVTGGNGVIADPCAVYGGGDETVRIPYRPEVYASAGGGAPAYMSDTVPVQFSRGFVEGFLGVSNAKGLHIINVVGDSMEPTLHNGELIFVNPIENEGFRDGGIYVLMCGADLMVKRVRKNPLTGALRLISDNPDVDDIELESEGQHWCKLIGRVVGQLERV